MSTGTKTKPGRKFVEFDQFIEYQVQKTQKTIKTTDLLTAGVGVMAMFLGYLLVFVVFDHWFVSGGFGIVSRWVMLGTLLLLTAGWVSWKILIPYLKNVNNLWAARSIENANQELKSSLLNLVDLRRNGHEVPEEIEHAIERRAAKSLSQMNVDEAIDRRPLMRLSYVLLAVVILCSLYTVFSPKKISGSLTRALFPSAEVEAATMIEITKVSCKLGRKDLPPSTEMLARSRPEIHVEIDYDGEPPESVVLHYTTADRKFRDVPVPMKRLTNRKKHYMAMLTGEYGQGLRQNLSYRISAGDAQAGPFEITVVEPPSATVEKLDYEYPEYMELPKKSMMGGHIDVWEGTEVSVHAVANQPIHRATLILLDSENPASEAGRIEMQIENETRLSVVLKREIGFRADGSSPHFYRIEAKNENGDTDPDPIIYGLTIRPDRKPLVKILFPEETEKKIPENTKELSILTEAHDPDFKVKFLTLKSEISKGNRPNADPIPDDHIIFRGLKKELKRSFRWNLKPLNLKTGDVVRFRIEARDNKTPSGNRGYSRWITLKIVKPVSEQERKQQQKQNREQAGKPKPDHKQKQNPQQKTDPRKKTKSNPKKQNKEGKKGNKQAKKQGDSQGDQSNQDHSDTSKQNKQGKRKKGNKQKSKQEPNRKQKNHPKKKQKSDRNKEAEKKKAGDRPSPEKKNEPENGDESQRSEKFKKDGSDDNKALQDLVDQYRKEQQKNPDQPQDKEQNQPSPRKKSKSGTEQNPQKKEPGKNPHPVPKKKKKKDSSQKNLSGTSSTDRSDSNKAKKDGTGEGESPKKDNTQSKSETRKNSKNTSHGKKQEQSNSNKKLKTEKQKASGNETGPAKPDRKKKSDATDSANPNKLKRKKGSDPSRKKQKHKPSQVDPNNVKKQKGITNPNRSKTTTDNKKNPSGISKKQRKDNNLKKGTKQKAKPQPENNSNTSPLKKSNSGEQTNKKNSNQSSKSTDPRKIEKQPGTNRGDKTKSKSDAQKQPGKKQGKGQKLQGNKTSRQKGSKKNNNNGTVQPGNGSKSQKGTPGNNQSPLDPEEADLEFGKKAANLTLDKLNEQLERGKVDENWLKKHGWSKDDLKQFINRSRKKIAGKNFSDEKMSPAEKLQFEESLKNLKYLNRKGLRRAGRRTADRLKGVGSRRLVTPPEYREVTEAFTRSLNKKKTGTKKR